MSSKSSHSVNLIVNVGMHVIILLVILTGVFVFVISKMTQDAFQNEFGDMTESAVNSALNQTQAADSTFKTTIQNNTDILTGLSQMFSHENQLKVNNNQWIIMTTVMVILFLLTLLVTYIATVAYVAEKRVPIWSILKQNLIAFLFIGMIEVWFFLSVAAKFVPTKASFLTKSILCRTRQNILGPENANCDNLFQ